MGDKYIHLLRDKPPLVEKTPISRKIERPTKELGLPRTPIDREAQYISQLILQIDAVCEQTLSLERVVRRLHLRLVEYRKEALLDLVFEEGLPRVIAYR